MLYRTLDNSAIANAEWPYKLRSSFVVGFPFLTLLEETRRLETCKPGKICLLSLIESSLVERV